MNVYGRLIRNIALIMMLCLCMVSFSACSGKGDGSSDSGNQPSGNDLGGKTTATISISTPENSIIVAQAKEEEETVEELPEEPVYEEIYDEVGKQYSVNPVDPERFTMGFVGDVGFAQGFSIINVYRQQANGVEDCISEEILSEMRGVDIMMANNEFPYSDRGTPTPDKTYTFRADPKDVHIMKDLGVDIVSLANNHAYDYGPDALSDTVDILNGAKLPFVGAGKNYEEASKPAYFHVNGGVVAYVSATQIERYGNPDTKEATEDSPGVMRTLDSTKFVAEIEEAAANSDFVVVYVHWGSESTDLVEQSQRNLANDYVKAGADLIIGDHSHCLQGIDYIDDVPVFYSLGNYWFNSKTLDTCIAEITVNSNDFAIEQVKFIPAIQMGSKVKTADESAKSRIISYMRGISNYANIDDDGIVTKSDTDNNTQNGQNTSPAKKVETPVDETALTAEDLINAALNAAQQQQVQ